MTAPTDVSRLHRDALLGLLNAGLGHLQVDGRYQVYDGEVTTEESDVVYPYLVVWASPATRPVNTQAGNDGAATTTTQVTAAGTSVDEVLAALDRATTALHRIRPTIVGRLAGPITQIPGTQPPQPNRDDRINTPTGRPVFFSFALFTLYSTPAGGTS